MEAQVKGVELLTVAGHRRRAHPGQRSLQLAQVERFDCVALGHQLHGQPFQRPAHFGHLTGLIERQLRHVSAAIGQPPNEAPVRQIDQRLTHRVLAHAQALCQLLFHQPVTGADDLQLLELPERSAVHAA